MIAFQLNGRPVTVEDADSPLLWAIRDEGAKITEQIDDVREEGLSPDELVWACADGQGFIKALVIDNEAIVDYSCEELEDLISDVMIEASGRGQAVGLELTKNLKPENFSQLLG